MKLRVKLPNNLITSELLMQELIPCLCKVSVNFELTFFETSPQVTGVMEEWDREELELRAISRIGGEFTHNACSRVTIKQVAADLYDVVHLEMFYRSYGWCVVIRDGQYADPRRFWDEE
jgi:hypothetical protein